MKRVCVEIDGVFYKSCRRAGLIIKYSGATIKNRCLSKRFPNYKIFEIPDNQTWCPVCEKLKFIFEFVNSSATKSGLKPQCKSCDKIYRDAHKVETKKYNKQYREENKEE